MKSVRKSNRFIKALSFILVMAIFNLSCSNVENQTIGCSNDLINISSTPDQVENAFELIRTVGTAKNPSSFFEFQNMILGENSISQTQSNLFDAEAKKYKDIGFESYLSDVNSRGLISNELKNQIVIFKDNLFTFIKSGRVNISEFTSFIVSQKNQLSSLNLCQNDSQFYLNLLNITQGAAQYYFKHFSDNNGEVELRECNFLEALGCFLLSTIVAQVIVFVVVLAAALLGVASAGTAAAASAEALVFGVVLGVWVGSEFYDWCCDGFKGASENCSPPTGRHVVSLGCNDFNYIVYGPGNYILAKWDNRNTNPVATVTTDPSLRLSVPTLGSPSTMDAVITCISSTGSTTDYPWNETLTFAYNATTPTIQWAQSPPSTAVVNANYNIAVITSGNGNVTWSISPFGGIIMTTGTSTANLKFWSSGQKTVTATITDICTGQTASITKQVFVQ